MADLQGSVDDANLQNTGGYQLVDDPNANDNGDAGRPSKKRTLADAGDDDDDDEKGGRERRKIDIKFINDKSRRHITFSKRKAGIMKKVCCAVRADASNCVSMRDTPCDYTIVTACKRYKFTVLTHLVTLVGLRAICPHWHSSAPPCRLRDWTSLHLHHTQAPAARHEA